MAEKIISADEARALLEGTTPGPWRSTWDDEKTPDELGEDQTVITLAPGREGVERGVVQSLYYDGLSAGCTREDARFIAAAPDLAETVIALHEECDRASEEIERLTGERNAARSTLVAERVEIERLTSVLKHVAHERDEARTEIKRLRAIVEGRAVAPTDEEIAAHEAADGRWRTVVPGEWIFTDDLMCAVDARSMRDVQIANATIIKGTARWWALDRDGRPCAWPEVVR